MSMTHTSGIAALSLLVLVASCGSEPAVPATDVDLTTPVEELTGWSETLGDLDLPFNRDQALANFVNVFRNGLDSTRRITDPEERVDAEANWWDEAARSLEAIVGPEQVDVVVRWLETVFSRRDGRSSV